CQVSARARQLRVGGVHLCLERGGFLALRRDDEQPPGGEHGDGRDDDQDDPVAVGHRPAPVCDVSFVADPIAAELGSGAKVTWMVNAGSPAPQLPEPPAPPAGDAPDDAVELWSVTSLTPSIRRRRVSVSATCFWLVAQPLTVKVGTLPGGVADVTVGAAAAPPAEVAVPVAAGVELLAAGVAAPAAGAPDADADASPPPTFPSSAVRLAPLGSTRPSSWNAWAQSKRASTRSETACMRSSRSAMKLVYGASCPASACARCARAVTDATSARRSETWRWAMP